jgi:16S rRNA C1402 (ribose-2'-O) methylase RsmI
MTCGRSGFFSGYSGFLHQKTKKKTKKQKQNKKNSATLTLYPTELNQILAKIIN